MKRQYPYQVQNPVQAAPIRPAIMVVPHPDQNRALPITYEEISQVARDMMNAKPGEAIGCPFPVTIYHMIDGLWIQSSDLPAFHGGDSPDETQPIDEDERDDME